jgi:signal peptidase II
VLVAVVGVDQALKALVASALPVGASIPVLAGVLSLTHVRNPGVAFSLFPQVSVLVPAAIALTLLSMFFYNEARRVRLPQVQGALALLAGGAVGNLIDRFRLGAVVDYIDFHVWPVFNFADMAVTAGAALLVLSLAVRPGPTPQIRGDR